MSHELYEVAVQKIKEAVLVAVEIHEAECGNPEDCSERANIIAYFAHCVGLKPENMETVKVLLEAKLREHEEHEKNCTDPTHRH